MKPSLSFLILFALSWPLHADNQEVPGTQRFESKVLEVYAVDGTQGRYRAYLVTWKDQKVIANDPLALSNFEAGDPIIVLAISIKNPRGEGRLLSFMIPAIQTQP